jgi:hypothetical protein
VLLSWTRCPPLLSYLYIIQDEENTNSLKSLRNRRYGRELLEKRLKGVEKEFGFFLSNPHPKCICSQESFGPVKNNAARTFSSILTPAIAILAREVCSATGDRIELRMMLNPRVLLKKQRLEERVEAAGIGNCIRKKNPNCPKRLL